MITIRVLDTTQNILVKLMNEQALLLRGQSLDGLKHMASASSQRFLRENYLLDHTTAIHLQRQQQNMTLHTTDKDCLLGSSAIFQELLYDLVKGPSVVQSMWTVRSQKRPT